MDWYNEPPGWTAHDNTVTMLSGAKIEIRYALDGIHYQLLRQAYFSPAASMNVGLMCASPEGVGFPVTFEGFTLHSV